MLTQFTSIPEDEPVISLTHIYNAPRALVWEAFTKPEHLKHWWGPEGFSIEHDSADIRAGGFWKFIMIGPDGTRWQNYHQFTEFSPMDRICHRHGTKPEDPDAFLSAITFTETDSKTSVTMCMTFPSMEARQGVIAFGADKLGLQTLAKAEAYLANPIG